MTGRARHVTRTTNMLMERMADRRPPLCSAERRTPATAERMEAIQLRWYSSISNSRFEAVLATDSHSAHPLLHTTGSQMLSANPCVRKRRKERGNGLFKFYIRIRNAPYTNESLPNSKLVLAANPIGIELSSIVSVSPMRMPGEIAWVRGLFEQPWVPRRCPSRQSTLGNASSGCLRNPSRSPAQA